MRLGSVVLWFLARQSSSGSSSSEVLLSDVYSHEGYIPWERLWCDDDGRSRSNKEAKLLVKTQVRVEFLPILRTNGNDW